MTRSISWIDPDQFRSLVTKVRARGHQHAPTKPDGTTNAASAKLSEFSPKGDGIEQRVAALVEWVDAEIACQGVFVTDDNGLAVLDRRTTPDQIAMSSGLMAAMRYIGRELKTTANRIMVSLGDEAVLHLVETPTEWGHFALGIVAKDTLPDSQLIQVQKALNETMDIKQ